MYIKGLPKHTRLLKQWIKKLKIMDCSLMDKTYVQLKRQQK